MAKPTEGLEGRLPFLEPTKLSAKQKQLFEQLNATFVKKTEAVGIKSKDEKGRFIGPFNAMLYSPQIGESFLALQEIEERLTSLSKRVRQVVILTIGSVWKAPYELYAHSVMAGEVGLTAQQIGALSVGQSNDGFSKEDLAAQQFTAQIIAKRSVDQDVYLQAQKIFGDRGLVEMLVLIGCSQSVCGFLNAFSIPAPVPPPT